MSEISKSYNPQSVEEKWYSFWEKNVFFQANAQSEKPPFSILMPPPNVTGVLHMGHALVNTVQDVLIRWKRMQGFEVLWVPGTDHAGIATQSVVEKQLKAKTGKKRTDFSREEFLKHVWSWKEESEKNILSQLKKLGCSCDWSRLRFTMDPVSNQAVRSCFKKMYDDGLIYQGDYLVNWDPVLQTALSDDEVELEEKESFLWHIRYPFTDGNGFIVVATTRPETLFGDVAVAVNPKDSRYQHFIGRSLQLPFTNRSIPLIGDPFVDSTFGSGAVKITPAHDFNDFEIAQRHHLPLINILRPDGSLNEQGGKWAGLDIEASRALVIEELQKKNWLDKIEPHTLRVGISYRSKAVLQPYLSKQWFIRMDRFKEKLISAVREKRVNLIPEHWEATYFHWIENLRDWCISRQLWWGHRIPIWYGPQGQIVCHDQETPPPEADLDPGKWTQDPDVLDTWFSSALWPFSVFGWPHQTEDLQKFYPTSTLVTGHDILFFWVARMILMGEYTQGLPPFRDAFLHGLIYGKSYWRKNEEGMVVYVPIHEKQNYDLGAPLPAGVESKWEKMSKTKGNVLDPLEIIEEYGTDALRIALCSSLTHARQIDLDKRKFEEFKNFANKLWNGARFVFLHLEGLSLEEFSQGLNSSLFQLEDQWILSVFNRTLLEVTEALSGYFFDRAATKAYAFFWNDFCAVYVELSKPILFGKQGNPEIKKNKQKILTILLLGAIRLLHPITPFITEELFSLLCAHFHPTDFLSSEEPYTQEALQALFSPACIQAPYPKVVAKEAINKTLEEEFHTLQEIIRIVRNLRTEMQLPLEEKIDLYLIGPSDLKEKQLAKQHQAILFSATQISRIFFEEQPPSLFSANGFLGSLKLLIPIPASLHEKEKKRLEKEREKLFKLKMNTEKQLNNPEFQAKAPSELIAKLTQTLAQTNNQLEEIGMQLKKL